MRKKLYYALPFIAVPALMLFCELLDNLELIKMTPYVLGALLILCSAVFGFFSPSEKSIDYLISLIMPLSLFSTMFVVGFLDKSDLETRFHLYKAINASFQPTVLFMYLAMAIITFIVSIKFFRNLKARTAS